MQRMVANKNKNDVEQDMMYQVYCNSIALIMLHIKIF